MYKLTHKDSACLLSILDAIEKIEGYTGRFRDADEFYENQQVFDATF